jgi:hypothetical protein
MRNIPEPDILDWPRGATETLERHVRFRMNSSHIWSRRRESIADRVCFLEYRDKDDALVIRGRVNLRQSAELATAKMIKYQPH